MTMQRTLGIERRTPVCFRCGAAAGGTVHACVCRAPGIAGENTVLHNRLDRELVADLTVATGLKPAAKPQSHLSV